LALPREPRTASADDRPAHSCEFEEGSEVDILCQKSDVAIRVSQTSKIYLQNSRYQLHAETQRKSKKNNIQQKFRAISL